MSGGTPGDWMRPDRVAAARAGSPNPPDLHTKRPHPARVYDYLLGGKDHFSSDRAAAEDGLALNPGARTAARANREWLRRVVTYLTREAGIRQFVDIGTGIPTSPNVHETAQAIAPDTRVVYADNDPIVLAHARALLTSAPDAAATDYIDADLRTPDRILARAAGLLDFARPVGLLLVAVLHHLPDRDHPQRIVADLIAALPPGSYLALSQITGDLLPEQWAGIETSFAARGGILRPRPRIQIARFFDGLDLVDPGLTLVHRWRPHPSDRQAACTDEEVSVYGGIARKP